MISEQVILVDEQDRFQGVCEKLEAHRKGLLHRAFSVFLFNGEQQLIMQKRALSKYHSAGLWSNTCCGHPRPGEELKAAAERRLMEEMGISCELRHRLQFSYSATLENGLIENELDHVFTGVFSGIPILNAAEASDWMAISLEKVKKSVAVNPGHYTYWFRKILEDGIISF
jgi:isopentenyl-diphosphate delta-isomerase